VGRRLGPFLGARSLSVLGVRPHDSVPSAPSACSGTGTHMLLPAGTTRSAELPPPWRRPCKNVPAGAAGGRLPVDGAEAGGGQPSPTPLEDERQRCCKGCLPKISTSLGTESHASLVADAATRGAADWAISVATDRDARRLVASWACASRAARRALLIGSGPRLYGTDQLAGFGLSGDKGAVTSHTRCTRCRPFPRPATSATDSGGRDRPPLGSAGRC
jgi:hypothetical protein